VNAMRKVKAEYKYIPFQFPKQVIPSEVGAGRKYNAYFDFRLSKPTTHNCREPRRGWL